MFIVIVLNLCKPMTYTSLPTSNKPNASTRANSGISARAGRPLIVVNAAK